MKKSGNLSRYEKNILESFEAGELKPVPDMKQEIGKYRHIFVDNQKDKSISLRINSMELQSFKSRASDIGIPYQTLITSLVKRFNEGKIKLNI